MEPQASEGLQVAEGSHASEESRTGGGVADDDESDGSSSRTAGRQLPTSESSATTREKELLDKVNIFVMNMLSHHQHTHNKVHTQNTHIHTFTHTQHRRML